MLRFLTLSNKDSDDVAYIGIVQSNEGKYKCYYSNIELVLHFQKRGESGIALNILWQHGL